MVKGENQTSRKFREHIFASFALYSVVTLAGAAAAIFATYKFTEDAVLADVLERFSKNPTHQILIHGSRDDVPPQYRPLLDEVEIGMTELDTTPGEAVVYKSMENGSAQYALLILPEDTQATNYFLALAVASIFVLALALRISWQLALKFSSPIEQISLKLAGDQALDLDAQGVEELDYLTQRIEQYRRDRNLRLAQASTFSQSISHELRTPITVIQGVVELLGEEDLSELARGRVERMRRAVQNLTLTTEVLLYITRREGQLDGTTFVDALRTVIEQQQAHCENESTIELELLDYPRSIYTWAPLVVLLQTLVANSVRFSPEGGISVLVDSDRAIVKDCGPGMSDECLRRVRKNQVGQGRLGYAIVHRICERCNWGLEVGHWESGLVTTINFTLPYQMPESIK